MTERKTMAEIDALKKNPAAYWYEYDHGGPEGETLEQRRMRMYDVIPHDMDDDPPPPRPRIVVVPVDMDDESRMDTFFVNELGNTISLSMEETAVTQAKLIAPCVLITMRGPTSTMQNQVTVKEAQEMHRMLGVLLDRIKK
jgi:hypothetical protein